jgi:hypothetical protein
MPTSKTGIPVWWQPQAPTPPPAPPPAPAAPAQPASSAGRTAGKLCIIFALILFVVFLSVNQPVPAVIIGLAGVATGALLIRANPAKPPGQLPPGGTSQGHK